MSADTKTMLRRHLRFGRYLPVECTVLSLERPHPRLLVGNTRNVSAGGLQILLSETLPVGSTVLVRVDNKGDPLRGRIVWVGRDTPTQMGTAFPHGVAFEQPVDASLVRQWASQPERRAHPRAQVQFDVEYTQAGTRAHGTCLDLSQGGMFIGTEHPAPPETEVILHFTPSGLSQSLTVLARVTWARAGETGPGAMCGMGVQFVEPKPSDAAAIGTVVSHVLTGASRLPDCYRFLPPTC